MLFLWMLSILSAEAKPEVAVIGAGLAGLTAAYRLHQKGYPVQVYEARGRVGGCVHTVLVKNTHGTYSPAELGGQGIRDGGEALHMLGLAKELGVKVIETSKPHGAPSFYDGEKHHDLNTLLSALAPRTETLDQIMRAPGYKTMQDVLDALLPDPADAIVKRFFTTRLSCYEGAPPDLLTVYHSIDTLRGIVFGDIVSACRERRFPHLTFEGGNAMLPTKIAEILKDRVHLHKAVTSIMQHGARIQLTFHDGTKVLCDKLVLAIPCSVYKDITQDVVHKAQWQKMLQVPYGTVAKILVATDDVPRVTTDNIVTFPNADSAVSNVFFEGKSGKRLLCDLESLARAAYTAMDKPFAMPVVPKDKQFVRYDKPVVACWAADPYAQGAYAYYGLALGEIFDKMINYQNTQVREIFRPVVDAQDNPVVVFAGAFNPQDHHIIGTMEAAVESGDAAAALL